MSKAQERLLLSGPHLAKMPQHTQHLVGMRGSESANVNGQSQMWPITNCRSNLGQTWYQVFHIQQCCDSTKHHSKPDHRLYINVILSIWSLSARVLATIMFFCLGPELNIFGWRSGVLTLSYKARIFKQLILLEFYSQNLKHKLLGWSEPHTIN